MSLPEFDLPGSLFESLESIAADLFEHSDKYKLFATKIWPLLARSRLELAECYTEDNGRPGIEPAKQAILVPQEAIVGSVDFRVSGTGSGSPGTKASSNGGSDQQSEEFQLRMHQRNAIEGTISHSLWRARYKGFAKVDLQKSTYCRCLQYKKMVPKGGRKPLFFSRADGVDLRGHFLRSVLTNTLFNSIRGHSGKKMPKATPVRAKPLIFLRSFRRDSSART